MKRILLILGIVAISATITFAQNGGYLLINNDNPVSNTVDIDAVSPSGALRHLATVPTGGTGAGDGFFEGPLQAVAQNLKCFWVSDSGSNDIASFQIPSLNKTGNFSNAALNGDYLGIGLAEAGSYLITAWSGSFKLAVLKINSDCTLTLVGSPISQPDSVFDVAVAANGKIAVVSYTNLSGAQAYSVGATGTLSPIGPMLNFNSSISGCSSQGCYPTSEDATSDGRFWVWGNATLGAPSTLTAILGSDGFRSVALQTYPTSLTNIQAPWFSPAGRAGTGNLYLSAFGFGTGYPAGIIVTTFKAGTITYEGSTLNSAASYAGNVQTIGKGGTGSPITEIWSDSLGNNTVQSYTVSGTILTPAASLQTSSSFLATSTTGVAK
jgi:hypothetical protein